jgi:hypothetical protein
MTDEDCARLPRDAQADGIAVIDTATLRPLAVLRGVSDPERVEVSRDDRTLFVSEEDAARLAVWARTLGCGGGALADPRSRAVREAQNLTMTPAPQTTSRVRRSGYQTPPALAQASAPMMLPLLHTKLAAAPVLPAGGVTPPGPDQ